MVKTRATKFSLQLSLTLTQSKVRVCCARKMGNTGDGTVFQNIEREGAERRDMILTVTTRSSECRRQLYCTAERQLWTVASVRQWPAADRALHVAG